MGLVNVVFSSVGKCVDVVSFLLDLNFVIVHNLVRFTVAVMTFINNLPTLLVNSLFDFGDLTLFCLISMAETTSAMVHGIIGSCLLAMAGMLESLKMVGYLSMHVVLRGKEQLYRSLLSLLECCSIALSLVLYFTNTMVNFALIATQNLYSAFVSVWQAVSSPLQKALELSLTLLTFLYSSLVGTSSFLWTPCKLTLDFLASLTHIFISIFILNIYGLLLTVTTVVATTLYLNPELYRKGKQWILQFFGWVVDYFNSVPALHRLAVSLHYLTAALQRNLSHIPGIMHQLQRVLNQLLRLERSVWRWLSQPYSRFGPLLRMQVPGETRRVGGDGDPARPQRDPPDGRAGDGVHQEVLDAAVPSSSMARPLKKLSGDDGKPPPADSLLSLLKEQEERKKCVICQDCAKTVVLLPCRHLCLCRDCTSILLRQPVYQQNCPLCRHMILRTMDVYL